MSLLFLLSYCISKASPEKINYMYMKKREREREGMTGASKCKIHTAGQQEIQVRVDTVLNLNSAQEPFISAPSIDWIKPITILDGNLLFTNPLI